ncbi:MAG: hypothetical protein WBC91_18800 [Phototrophicaceae bacterium]
MIIKYLQYRYVKARMGAYLDGELSPQSRRFIARQIDENTRCYRLYIDSKQTKQELERYLPSMGKPQTGQLESLWLNIQSELHQPQQRTVHRQPKYSLSYGVALLVLAIMLLTPLALDTRLAYSTPIADYALPVIDTAQITSAITTPDANVQVIALAHQTDIHLGATRQATVPLQNTPAPRTPSN